MLHNLNMWVITRSETRTMLNERRAHDRSTSHEFLSFHLAGVRLGRPCCACHGCTRGERVVETGLLAQTDHRETHETLDDVDAGVDINLNNIVGTKR